MAESTTAVKQTSNAKAVVDLFDKWWTYSRDNHHRRWERNYKLVNNKRVNVGYRGTTNTFVPIPFSLVHTATAALTSGRPSIDFEPQDMYSYIMSYYQNGKKPDLKALNTMFDYFWTCDRWDHKTIYLAQSAFQFGLGGELIYWDGDKPRIISIPVRDIIVDPDLTDPLKFLFDAKNTYGGRRFFTTKEALEAETVVDPATGEDKKRYKNLRYVRPGVGHEEMDEKQLREMFMGAIGDRSKLIEVIEIWDGEKVRSVANRCMEIENRTNELGIIPIALQRFLFDETQIVGRAILDPVAEEIEYLIDTKNQAGDAITQALVPQWELDPMYAAHIAKVAQNKMGTVYPFAPGSLKPIQKQMVDSSAFAEMKNIKNEIYEATGIDSIVQGVGDQGDPTATEVNAQLNQAGQRFSIYEQLLENEGLYMRAKIVYKMLLKYQTEKRLVPTSTVDGPKFFAFDPAQFDDTYEPKITLESRVRSKRRAEQRSAIEGFSMMIQDPTNDLWQVKKIMYPKMFDLKDEELDSIIGAQKPMQDPMSAGMGMGADPMAPEAGAPAMPPGAPDMPPAVEAPVV